MKSDKHCEYCNVLITNRNSKKYCSIKCYNKARIGRKPTEAALSKMRGRKLSAETIAKQNAAKQRSVILKIGDFTCEKCKKYFDTNTALRAHKSYCNASEHEEISNVVCEICDRAYRTKRGLKIHITLCHTSSENVKFIRSEKMKQARSNHKFRLDSAAEIAFYNEIKCHYPDTVRNFKIDGYRHIYDMFIPSQNVIIEFDGDFWHGNEKLHKLSARMHHQHDIDFLHTEHAKICGYNILRIWQSNAEIFIAYLEEMQNANSSCNKNQIDIARFTTTCV